ncbi:MAG TPA: hypothetical protein VIX73_24605 [Kofleriaceae bacterium]|jgi:hypothetical protein
MRCLIALALLAGCREVHSLADASSGNDGAIDARAIDAAIDAAGDPVDGPPIRLPCTGTFGTALSSGAFGRLDGFLVAIVPPGGSRTCHADSDHLHLQIKVSGQIYDIAVNIGSDVHTTTIDRPAFSAWTEGWHVTGDGTSGNVFVDYPGLGLHANTIPLSTTQALITAMTDDFAAVNHISIYATSYDTQDGAHLVHYNGAGHDGMIVTKPLSPSAHMRAFSFDSSSF